MNAEIIYFTSEFDEYLRDESRLCGHADGLVFAKSETDVQAALQAAGEKGWSVTTQGARTGIAGGAVPEGGLIINLSRMKQMGNVIDKQITVQPGALLAEIQDAVMSQNLFFPPDPTETSASIGGMLSCNASGAQSFYYGSTRNWVQALRVVLANGDVLKIKRGMKANGLSYKLVTESGRKLTGELPNLKMPEVKSAAGYFLKPNMDLIDLFIGMEGTLGIITEIELKLIDIPPVRQVLCAFFKEEKRALQFIRFLREKGPLTSPPVSIEFFDHCALSLLRRMKTENPAFSELPELPEHFHTAIYFEFHGSDEDTVDESVLAAAEQMTELGASEADCWFAGTPREINKLKTFRHATPEAVNLLIDQRKREYPDLTKLGSDMSVPDEHLESVMQLYRNDLTATGLEHVIFGHIGNNHLHVNILPRNMNELAQGKALYLEWAGKIVAMGGSVSAEHGIGKIKVPLMKKMFGSDGISAMRQIKLKLDPDERLNPGNLFELENK